MEINLSLSLLLSIGGIVASVASSLAIAKTKLSQMESSFDEKRKEIDMMNVKIALLESNQEHHEKELAEMKSDIKTIMSNVQDIREAVIKTKKG